jgi:hypothetical protein
MKLGFTPEEAVAIWKPLWKEAREFFNYPGRVRFVPRTELGKEYGGLNSGTIASTWFGFNATKAAERATLVTLNPMHRALIYEDELRAVLLHEAAHVVGTFWDGHNVQWQSRAACIGTVPEQYFFIRNYRKLTGFARPRDEVVEAYGGPTMDKY